ncbi:MAG: aldehyde:ferredoxin oxidoreductase [Synergistaceae bacterium]|nr:aldehyde:ferredoxin oxidoreductase [Synergistaceae bacterium]
MKPMKLLSEWSYEPAKIHRGYSKETLYVGLGNKDGNYKFEKRPVSEDMIEKFTGGRGFGLRLLWNAVKDTTKWNDPENEIVIAGGPFCGITQYPGAGKCYSVFLSPATKQTYNSNAGGYFAPFLKFSGFDAMELQGKADRPVVVFIDGDNFKVQIFESTLKDINAYHVSEELHEYFSKDEEDKRTISVVSSGIGARTTYIAGMNFSFYDVRRKAVRLKQAGRGGGGSVLCDKNVVALVVKRTHFTGLENDPADVSVIQRAGASLHKRIHDNDDAQCKMRSVGTAHLTEIMNDYQLLPVNNYKFGSHPDIENISSRSYIKLFTQGMADGCWYGCSLACAKAVDHFPLQTGPWKGKEVIVDGPEYETAAGLGSNLGIFDPFWTIEANFYADNYGLDTISLGTDMAWVCECYELGLINKEDTHGLELNFGNKKDIMELIHRIAHGTDEFAVACGKGIEAAREYFAEHYGSDMATMKKIGMVCQGLEASEYRCQESIAQWGGYFLTLKGPQHDEAWLIFMDMVNKQLPTFEDKAEALFFFPCFRLWFSLQGLCKLPWNDIEPVDNGIKYKGIEAARVPEHLKNYLDIFEAITGKPLSQEGMILQSEKVYNFERIFNLRMGKGTSEFHVAPDRGLGPVWEDEWNARPEYFDEKLKEFGEKIEGLSVKDKITLLQKHRRAQWEQLKLAVYKRRGWNKNGIPTLDTVKRLGIDYPDVIELLNKHLKPEDEFEN